MDKHIHTQFFIVTTGMDTDDVKMVEQMRALKKWAVENNAFEHIINLFREDTVINQMLMTKYLLSSWLHI